MKNSTNSAPIMMTFLHFILGIIIDVTFTTDSNFILTTRKQFSKDITQSS